MIVKYRINKYYSDRPQIERVEIVKETEMFVMLPEIKHKDSWRSQRARREEKGGNYYDTFADAKAELVRRRERSLQYADDARSCAVKDLKEANALTEPPSQDSN